jgi:hypothetical protein
MRYDYILIKCRASLNMDKKHAKRETVRDQTFLLNEVRTFTGKHLTQSDVGEVRRAVTNTGKYAVPIYYIRVHEDDPVSLAILIVLATLSWRLGNYLSTFGVDPRKDQHLFKAGDVRSRSIEARTGSQAPCKLVSGHLSASYKARREGTAQVCHDSPEFIRAGVLSSDCITNLL